MAPFLTKSSFLVLLMALSTACFAQESTGQVIRGKVIDDISKFPIRGATIRIEGVDRIVSATTDINGIFILNNIQTGRFTLLITCTGYDAQVANEVLVTAGKEVVLEFSLTERINSLKEVVIHSPGSKKKPNNEMAAVSATTFNAEDARKFAGALGDPSRMIASSAGVSSSNDSRNDIVVRGNSPTGLLWQMEGIDIPNPNHYGSLSSTGGPVSMLNINALGKSDFITSAFPAQYGNAIASVFDLHLRDGNSEKAELLGEVSFTGFEFGAEGPLSKKNKSSFLINYRYSTLGVLHTFGLNIGTGNSVPQYQDLTFKVSIPLWSRSKLAVFGIGGPSHVNFLGADVDTTKSTNVYGGENENLYTKYFTGIAGVTLETNFDAKTFGKLSVGYSRTTENIQHDSISVSTKQAFRDAEHNYSTNRMSLSYFLTHKFDNKNSMIWGTNNSLIGFDIFDKRIYGGGATERINLSTNDNMLLLQAFTQWKHRFTEYFSMVAGVHYQVLTLNNTNAVEPRIGLKYVTNNSGVFSFGYGMHSLAQNPLIYFYQTDVNNQVYYTNKNLGFTKSQHFVLGYDYSISNNLHIKTEAYYQYISNVPVEISPSGFSLLNEGADFGVTRKDSLYNKGTGKNYGIEVTLEKYYSQGSYFLITGSLFNSKYKGSDGIEHNTAFNTRYVFNVLAGKEFKVGKKQNTLSANIKLAAVGGKYTSPVDIYASQHDNTTDYDETVAPFSMKQSAYFRGDLKFGYRKNNRRSTLEMGVDLQNFTNHKNIFLQTYNRRTQKIAIQYQQGFLPVPYFRLTF